jgi:CRISPR/Cas system CSM-associated protein Csm3 (group 7 of RAMP superfamily)
MTVSLTIKITNLSSLLLGSGEGWSASIDTDLSYDTYGFPYFPARRLKGLLRESAQEALEMLHKCQIHDLTQSDLEECFGKKGNIQTADVSFSNLYFEDYHLFVPWLKWAFKNFSGVLSSQELLSTMTEIRMQTAIEKDGIAREGSLRSCRVLRPGYTFQGVITVRNENPKLIKLLTLSCLNLRRVGSNRNRGLGEVSCNLYREGKELKSDIIKGMKGA